MSAAVETHTTTMLGNNSSGGVDDDVVEFERQGQAEREEGQMMMTMDDDDDEDDEEEYLGRIRRRVRHEEEEAEEEEAEDGEADGKPRRRLKRANGERVQRDDDDDLSDSSDFSSDEDEDEEMLMERKYAETGRLTDEEVEEDPRAEEAYGKAGLDGYSSSSSEGLAAEDVAPVETTGRMKKKSKRQLKKERDALQKEQEKMMRRAERRARFPGWNEKPERQSYLPLIEKLRAAVAHLKPVSAPEVPRPAPEATAVVALEESDDEGDEKLELCLDDDEEDDAALKAMLAKKVLQKAPPATAPAEGEEKEASGDEEDKKEAESEESEDDLSDEEEMTEEQLRLNRKEAKRFAKADAKAKKRAEKGDFFEDEAEMSEDGGHTDDDDDDDDNMRDEIDDMAEMIDFRQEQEDERRTARRAAAHARIEQEQDDADLEKLKEAMANGFKRKKDGAFDVADKWQRRKRNANAEEDSDDDFDTGPVIERPEEAVELSDDDDGEWREQAARRRALAASGTQDMIMDLPPAFEGIASQEISAAVLARTQSKDGESQEPIQGLDALRRTNSMPPLTRTASQAPGAGPMLSRQASTSFVGKKRQASKVNGPMLGNSQASRSFVFGRSDSQSQWGADTEAAPTQFKELGRDDEARVFGLSNSNGPSASQKSDTKRKQSLFAIVNQNMNENDQGAKRAAIENALKNAKSQTQG